MKDIEITCPSCNRTTTAPATHAGKRVFCSKCKTKFTVPSDDFEVAFDQPEPLRPLRSPGPHARHWTAKPAVPKEPAIYRWVDRWAKGLIGGSLLLFASGVFFVAANWIDAHNNISELRQNILQYPSTYGGRTTGKAAEQAYKTACNFFQLQFTGIALFTLLLLLVAGCALILVDIGRTTREANS